MITSDAIYAAWKLAPILSTWKPNTGTVHSTLLFRTAEGNYAFRAYRYAAEDRWRIECEHALIAYVQAQGLPAVAPLPLQNGKTIFEYQEHFYALFPFASGCQVPRGKLTLHEVTAMGSFLGKIHQVLRDYPLERVPQRSFVFDTAATLTKMDMLKDVIRARSAPDEVDKQALAQLMHQREWLASSVAIVPSLANLEHQVIHGDYQEANLFFKKDSISAVIDWDQSYLAPRAWEVVRTLDYALNLDIHLSHVFIEAYRTVLPLTREEMNIAAECYGLKRAHDVWVYETLYLENNQRVRIYFQSRAVPLFAERWASFQKTL